MIPSSTFSTGVEHDPSIRINKTRHKFRFFIRVDFYFSKDTILFLFVALYGFAHGALFVVVSPTIAEYFGLRDHASLFGIVVFCGTIGGAIGPILAGSVFDLTGSYNIAFATLFILITLSSIVVLTLPETTKKNDFS